MTRDLNTMGQIMDQKDRDLAAKAAAPELTPEIKKLAAGKRFTFDIINIPVDPLR